MRQDEREHGLREGGRDQAGDAERPAEADEQAPVRLEILGQNGHEGGAEVVAAHGQDADGREVLVLLKGPVFIEVVVLEDTVAKRKPYSLVSWQYMVLIDRAHPIESPQ